MTEPLRKWPNDGMVCANDRQNLCACCYNLFRNINRPELLCAVPLDKPAPGFIQNDRWVFQATLYPSDPQPPGFRPHAAQNGTRLNGFYLFQVTSREGSSELAAVHGSLTSNERALREHVIAVLRKVPLRRSDRRA
jgi:hypothetical protein